MIQELVKRYPVLDAVKDQIEEAYKILETCYENGGKLLIAGNGGSAADSDHIVGELMKGFKNLALLGGNQSYDVTGSRYQGFLEAHKEMRVPVNESLIFMDADNQVAVSDAVKRLLEEGADGIVCMDDVICSMCLSSLREKKIQIPSEIKVASMYDSKNLEYNNPPITSIRFDTVRLGKMACVKLLKILGENPQEDTRPLNYQVVLRESTQ